MKLRGLILLLVFLLLSMGCFNKHRNFILHAVEPLGAEKIKYNGMYTILDNSRKDLWDNLCFYADGKVWYGYNWTYKNGIGNSWGHYQILSDSIYIQYFYFDNQNFYKRDVMELFGNIVNDSTIQVYKKRCTWCKNVYIGYDNNTEIIFPQPIQFHYKKGIKPDSSKAWFNNKKWYKQGLKK